jgi:hypothetical protein
VRASGCLAGVLVSLASAAPALAQVDTEAIARSVATQAVYAQPRAGVARTEAAALRRRIARRDPGRIRLVVLRAEEAQRSGGVEEIANAIDQAGPRAGALLVAAGRSFWVVTTYPQSHRTASAVRRAVSPRAREGLAAQLTAAVDALAEVDPGPGGEPGPAGTGRSGSDPVEDVSDAIATSVLVIASTCALVVLGFGLWLLLRARRRRAEDAEALAEDYAGASESLTALADDIGLLDLDVSMPGADPIGCAAYYRAVELYERASRQLDGKRSRRRLAAATATLGEARSSMDEAKARLAPASPSAEPG